MPTILGREIGSIGFGLMGFTWRANPVPHSEAIKTMKCALEAGANMWNAGTFYGPPTANSIHLLQAYFTQYPSDAPKVLLSVKGGMNVAKHSADSSKANLTRDVDDALKILGGLKSIDIFQCGRVDPEIPIEETMEVMKGFVKEGKIGGIGLSEVGAKTIRRAAKIHPIAAVEVEFSLFSPDILENDVAATCAELGIPIVAYSPLGRGFLTGQIKTYADVTEQHKFGPRFAEENFAKNLELVETIRRVAEKKGVTSAQLALGWVRAYSGRDGNPIIVPLPGATKVERVEENCKLVDLTEEELKEIGDILKSMPVKGARVPKFIEHLAWA
ncbi:Pyridoxal reductase [Hyphodiscus hymeniophilus]|uniref:Pyridoxal reductase n=1 Tax=Hyphodiscus hymeniophilus TaxID=353542 RepID=A0A9P7AU82_9HELO|nr:Pyridoxal reductase [Hyphodiscus hymeniophilus]